MKTTLTSTILFRSVLIGTCAMSTLPAQAAVQEDSATEAKADAAPPAGVQSAPDDGESAEIVVTASRRSQRLIEVPMAMTAIDAEAMSDRGVQQLVDLAAYVPGLNLTSEGGVGKAYITLRGVTTGADNSPLVGVYVDDVPYGSPTPFTGEASYDLDLALFDMERVEVLKGPQGTLYGASSMGGLVKYVDRQPSLTEFSTKVEGEVADVSGGEADWALRGTVSIPLGGVAGLKVSGYRSQYGGVIDDAGSGLRNIDDNEVYGGRATLRVEPVQDLSIRLSAATQTISRNASSQVDVDIAAGELAFGNRSQFRFMPETSRSRFHLLSGTVEYEMSFASLISITSWQKNKASSVQDGTPALAPLFEEIGIPIPLFDVLSEAQFTKFTQEIRLSSPSNQKFEWIIGGFYTDENIDNMQAIRGFNADRTPFPLEIGTFVGPASYKEISGFGDITYYLSDKLDITAGARIGKNTIEYAQSDSGLLAAEPLPLMSTSETVDTYLGSIRYRPTSDLTVYLRAASGYRPGGPNAVALDPITGNPIASPTYDSDSLWNYEIGAKHSFWGNRAYVELSLFQIDWENIQLLTTENTFTVIANGGSARSRGVEFSAQLKPVDNLSIAGSLAYTDAELREDAPALGFAFKGDAMPNVPKWAFALSADYKVHFGGAEGEFGISWNHVGARPSGFDTPDFTLEAYDLVGLRFTTRISDYKATLFVNNLLNEKGYVSYDELGPLGLLSLTRPRRIGIRLTADF